MTRRPGTIGGSQAAAAAGLNPWCSPRELFLELTEGTERPATRATRRGLALEPEVCADYAELTGLRVVKPAEESFYRDWRRASPDRMVIERDQVVRGLEAKTANSRVADKWGPHGSQDIPVEYWVQVVWYMHVTQIQRWDVAVWIEEDFRVYPFERDLEAEEDLVEVVTDWREKYLIPGIEPPPATPEEQLAHLIRAWRKTSGQLRVADAQDVELLERIRERRHVYRTVEAQLLALEVQLRERIGDADGMDAGELGRIHCKPQKGRAVVDYDAVGKELGERIKGADVLYRDLVTKHTREAKPSRPLRFPQKWSKEQSE